jgi:hypothetical protein
LSVGIEIAALSALAAISAQMGSKVYFPFGIVTLIQFIGNIFFAYQYIDINSQAFKDWVDLVDPLVSYLGVESGDYVGHKRFLSLFSGGMLPIISLSFLHMLVKFEEEEKKKVPAPQPQVVDIDQLSIQAGKMEAQIDQEKYTPSKEELERLEDELRKLNEQKFGALQPEIVENYEVLKDELSEWDTTLMDGLEDESNLSDAEKKTLSYVRSHTNKRHKLFCVILQGKSRNTWLPLNLGIMPSMIKYLTMLLLEKEKFYSCYQTKGMVISSMIT